LVVEIARIEGSTFNLVARTDSMTQEAGVLITHVQSWTRREKRTVISQETPNTRYIHRIHDDALETMGK
jgi:hypothetical protein